MGDPFSCLLGQLTATDRLHKIFYTPGHGIYGVVQQGASIFAITLKNFYDAQVTVVM
jgi:hypothetical protein